MNTLNVHLSHFPRFSKFCPDQKTNNMHPHYFSSLSVNMTLDLPNNTHVEEINLPPNKTLTLFTIIFQQFTIIEEQKVNGNAKNRVHRSLNQKKTKSKHLVEVSRTLASIMAYHHYLIYIILLIFSSSFICFLCSSELILLPLLLLLSDACEAITHIFKSLR